MEDFLSNIQLPKLTPEQSKNLSRNITQKEIEAAITHVKSNKAPGPDGFSSEFYKVLKESLIPVLQRTFNWILKENKTPPSWSEAVISLIPKEGKDKLECGNYRPISVLNQDYKIFTHIIAKRVETVLPQIISLDQTGFIRQRQTHDNTRRTLHVINHIINNNIPALLVGLDAEKAFDCVCWSFLYKVLTKFGFDNTLINTI